MSLRHSNQNIYPFSLLNDFISFVMRLSNIKHNIKVFKCFVIEIIKQ